jgi:hypothetical protein
MGEFTDYTGSHSFIEIEKGKLKVYASVNQEMYCKENRHTATGKYFIYLLDPGLGSIFFRMEQDIETAAWSAEGAPGNVDPGIIALITDVLPK